MACCNNKRNRLKNTHHQESNHTVTAPSKMNTTIKFVYEGKGSKVVSGTITRNSYRFRFQGHMIAVDERDKAGCMAESDLRFVE